MTGKDPLLGMVAAAFAVAIVLRWMLPSSPGVTVYLPRQTRYIGGNVLAFWGALIIALAVAGIALAETAEPLDSLHRAAVKGDVRAWLSCSPKAQTRTVESP